MLMLPSCRWRRSSAPAVMAEDIEADTTATVPGTAEETGSEEAPPSTSKSAVPEPKAATVWININDSLQIDKTVHDFGDILTTGGPQKCFFTILNRGTAPLTLFEVISSCGCTEVDWPRKPIAPGGKGTISATFKNEDGPVPFDKVLTVYYSGEGTKPFLLHLRGVVHEKPVPLSESYGAFRRGPLGFKEVSMKTGNLEQGEVRSAQATIANLGTTGAKVTFTETDPQLTVSLNPNPVPAGGTATLTWTVSSDRSRWGKNYYLATPVVNGKSTEPIEFWAITKENFATWTEAERRDASQPIFTQSTFVFDTQPRGKEITAVFTLTNKGKSPFHCYSIDSDTPCTIEEVPDVSPGEQGSFKVTVPTEGLPSGETTVILTLITNSPLRPVINLFIVGILA